MEAPRLCLACGVVPRKARRIGGVQLLRCPRCRLEWWRWASFRPEELYDQDYFQSSVAPKGYADYAALEPGLRRTAQTRLRTLRALGAPRGALLDVGCGTGVFLDEAVQNGWRGSGIEPSAFAAEVARQRGLSVETGAIEDVSLSDAALDCVTLWDCIEHLPAPGDALQRLARRLRPGGVLALSTGDVTSLCARWQGRHWHLYNFPEHLFFFSPQSLRLLLAKAGCRVVRIRREVNWVTSGYLVERLSKTLLGRTPPGGASGMLIPATLGDVLGVYAVRVADGERVGPGHTS